MIDPQAKLGPYVRILALAALLGVITAVVTFVFVALVQLGTQLVWEQAAPVTGLSAPLLTLLICTLGGLLVGLLVRVFGDHNGIFADIMREFGKTGRFDYRHAPGIVITALVSLISGGSLGPEAPLADASGGIGTVLADRLKLDPRETRTLSYSGLSGMLGAFITSPIGGPLLALEAAQGGAAGLTLYFWVLFPSIVASAVATVVFVALTGSFFGTLYAFPEYVPKLFDLLLAVPLGLIGGLVGAVFFVVLFVGVALGLAANQLFPSIPAAVAVAATLAGAVAATLRSPLFAIFFTAILVQQETVPVIAIAVVAASLLTAVLALLIARREQAQAEAATPATA